jgi:hypothetical protein
MKYLDEKRHSLNNSSPQFLSLSVNIEVIHVQGTGNINIGAQGGCFTTITSKPKQPFGNAEYIGAPLEKTFLRLRDIIRTNVAAENDFSTGTRPLGALTKCTLPASEGRPLLRTLHRLDYDASRLFPDMRGCVETLREKTRLRGLNL